MLTRISPAGKVCSGDLLEEKSDVWKQNKDYFMKYEGNFISLLFYMEAVTLIVMVYTFAWISMYRSSDELLFGLDLFRRRLTVVPNFKNFKNIKSTRGIWRTYTKMSWLGRGQFGEVFRVRLNSTNKIYAMKIMNKQ